MFALSEKQTKYAKIICTALLTRYPFWKSISFLLFVSDLVPINAKNGYIVFSDWFIYTIVGLYFICGIVSVNRVSRSSWCFLFLCLLQAIVAYTIYTHESVKYSMIIKFKLITYHIGVSGIFLFLASLVTKSQKEFKVLYSLSNLTLFTYLLFLTFLFLNSDMSKMFNKKNDLIVNLIVAWSTIAYSLISMSFFTNKFKSFTTILCILTLLVVNCMLIDTQFNYWSKHNLRFWTQIGLLIDNICISIGFFYIFMFESYKIKFE